MKKIIAIIVTVFDFVFYLSMRSIWSGIEGMFGVHWLQYLLFGLLTGLAAFTILWALIRPKCKAFLGLLIAGLVLALPLFYMFYLGRGSFYYISRSFLMILAWLALIDFGIFMIFYYPKSRISKRKSVQFGLLGILVVLIAGVTFNLGWCYLSQAPVVYAVEDEYQIVWTTSTNATGQVKVGSEIFSDLSAGSLDSETKVHKVIVPMPALDAAGSYEITSTQILYRGPYSGVNGRTLTKEYVFHPVDLTDGLNYFTLSDSHEYTKAASAAGAYFGDELDFLILAGDIASHLEQPSDIGLILKIAHNITGGSHPVVYARGNHETKGDVAADLADYVGSKDGKFYYTVSLGRVFMVVLDLGEDHDDDWWEFYGTANYDEYRAEQTDFLEETLLSPESLNLNNVYKMAICHIPTTYATMDSGTFDQDELFLLDIKTEWTDLLNDMNLDMMVSGHHHQLMPLTAAIPANTPLYYHEDYWEANSTQPIALRTDAEFPTFIVSRRSNVQTPATAENLFGKAFTGLATTVDFRFLDAPEITLRYVNALGEIVPVTNPFLGGESSEFILEGQTIQIFPLN
jgi:hypothetical protein